MEIILRQNVDELGREGDVVTVARGYARNYLIPKGFAFQASSKNKKTVELQRTKIEARQVKAAEAARAIKEKMDGMVITLSQKAGEEGKLYGSVTSMDIAARLEREGIVIDRKKIQLEKPLKALGEYDVPIRIYPNVTGTIKVEVVPEAEEEGR